MKSSVKILCTLLAAALCLPLLAGCGSGDDPSMAPLSGAFSGKKAAPFVPAADGSNYMEPIARNLPVEEMEAVSAAMEPQTNVFPTLSVPTWITRIGDTWFLVDCYHNQVLFSDDADAPHTPLSAWHVMTGDATQPHTVAGDGAVFLVDDTEKNRVLVFERVGANFINTQTFWNIGDRPHYTVYDETTDTFYVWSSRTGELYLYRRADGTNDVYQTEIRRIPLLSGIYVRSFTILGDRIYFVSGVSSAENTDYTPSILCCELATLDIIAQYPVPDALAGMTQLTPSAGYSWFISVSTDAAGDQDAATLLYAEQLTDLAAGNYETVYDRYFIGGGTPYYISRVGNDCFLTEHRITGHALWRFTLDKTGRIDETESLY